MWAGGSEQGVCVDVVGRRLVLVQRLSISGASLCVTCVGTVINHSLSKICWRNANANGEQRKSVSDPEAVNFKPVLHAYNHVDLTHMYMYIHLTHT